MSASVSNLYFLVCREGGFCWGSDLQLIISLMLLFDNIYLTVLFLSSLFKELGMRKNTHYGERRNLINSIQPVNEIKETIKVTAASKYRRFTPQTYKQASKKTILGRVSEPFDSKYFSISSLQKPKKSEQRISQLQPKMSSSVHCGECKIPLQSKLMSFLHQFNEQENSEMKKKIENERKQKLTFKQKQDEENDLKNRACREKNLGDSFIFSERDIREKLMRNQEMNLGVMSGHLKDLQIEFSNQLKTVEEELRDRLFIFIHRNEEDSQKFDFSDFDGIFNGLHSRMSKIEKKIDQIIQKINLIEMKELKKRPKMQSLKENSSMILETMEGINLRVTLNKEKHDHPHEHTQLVLSDQDKTKSIQFEDWNKSKESDVNQISFSDRFPQEDGAFTPRTQQIFSDNMFYSFVPQQNLDLNHLASSLEFKKNNSTDNTKISKKFPNQSLYPSQCDKDRQQLKNSINWTSHTRKRAASLNRSTEEKFKGFEEALRKIKNYVDPVLLEKKREQLKMSS